MVCESLIHLNNVSIHMDVQQYYSVAILLSIELNQITNTEKYTNRMQTYEDNTQY